MAEQPSPFSFRDREMIETYMLSRVGQVPEAVARLLATHDALVAAVGELREVMADQSSDGTLRWNAIHAVLRMCAE